MLPGLNHNFKYKDLVFHIQTEDTGKLSFTVVTHLYLNGTIIATKKTYYGDARNSPEINQIVKDLIDTQHKQMLLDLKNGMFDDKIRVIINDQV